MLSVVGQLHCQLNKGIRMQFPLFNGCFSKGGECITHKLQVLCLGNQTDVI